MQRPEPGCVSLAAPKFLCAAPLPESPISKTNTRLQLQSDSWTEKDACFREGKEYSKLNAFSATHPRLILSYPRLNSLKQLPTNRLKQTSQARRSDKHNVRTGGCDCQASSHLHTDSLSLLSRWDTHPLHNSSEKLVETCFLVLNMHVELLTPSLRNISIIHSASLGKGWESFLNSSVRHGFPESWLRMR